MVLRWPVVLGVVLLVLAALGAVALLIPRGGEKLVAHATSAIPADKLRDCLGTKLGLTWTGDDKSMHASAFGLRVVVADSGKSRLIGMFTDGGRHLSTSEDAALTSCQVTG